MFFKKLLEGAYMSNRITQTCSDLHCWKCFSKCDCSCL